MPRVKIVYDCNGWAWHFRAMDFAKFAPPEYDIEVQVAETFHKHLGDRGFFDGVDSVFYMGWAGCPIDRIRKAGCKRLVSLVTSSGPAYHEYDENNWMTRIVTNSRNYGNAHSRLPRFDAVIAVNEFLRDACLRHTQNIHLIPSGVNTDVFCLPSGNYPPPKERTFRVGWCGNIKGTHTVKGHEEILKPLMAARPNWDWRVNTNDRRNAWMREQMSEWYQDLDAFVCTSINEGTPSPVFEAASCGVPIVSTDVGCVADWKLPNKIDLVVPAYSNESESQVTIEVMLNRLDALKDLGWYGRAMTGACLRDGILEHYDYRVIAPKYLEAICPSEP